MPPPSHFLFSVACGGVTSALPRNPVSRRRHWRGNLMLRCDPSPPSRSSQCLLVSGLLCCEEIFGMWTRVSERPASGRAGAEKALGCLSRESRRKFLFGEGKGEASLKLVARATSVSLGPFPEARLAFIGWALAIPGLPSVRPTARKGLGQIMLICSYAPLPPENPAPGSSSRGSRRPSVLSEIVALIRCEPPGDPRPFLFLSPSPHFLAFLRALSSHLRAA